MLEVKKAEENNIRDFLRIPKMLYPKKLSVQSESDEAALLDGTHALSKYFDFTGFVCYMDGEPCARCAVTLYPDSAGAYIGFFECIDNESAAKALMDAAENFAKENGRTRLTGPVDASFWIKYRMKTSHFNGRPYFSEPYNKDYYLRLWKSCGYEISQEYISNIYDRLDRKSCRVSKCMARYKRFENKGYKIISPDSESWDRVFGEVYALITELYSEFPVYADISEEDFRTLFGSFKLILDFSMVKIAYYEGRAVGFFIGIPDYKNRLYGKVGAMQMLYVLMRKLRSPCYIFSYMGVSSEHLGLGNALTMSMLENVGKRHASSVGAFIKKGKVTGTYAKERIKDVYEYVLLEKRITVE